MECFMCKGELEVKKVNYIVDLDNTVIFIKDVPAKVCKKCGEKFYDNEIAANIEKIVNQLKELAVEDTVVKYNDKIA